MVETFQLLLWKKYGEGRVPKTVELMKIFFKEMKLNNFDTNGASCLLSSLLPLELTAS
jgi:hypothetical protein